MVHRYRVFTIMSKNTFELILNEPFTVKHGLTQLESVKLDTYRGKGLI